MSKGRIKVSFGISIPRPLAYGALIKNVHQIDVGEIICLRETLCAGFPP